MPGREEEEWRMRPEGRRFILPRGGERNGHVGGEVGESARGKHKQTGSGDRSDKQRIDGCLGQRVERQRPGNRDLVSRARG